MPFGPYKDMADCIAKNQDAKDPGAYCAQIHKDITGKWPSEAMQKDWDKCIAENKDKPDPETHCANLLGIPIIHTGFEHESLGGGVPPSAMRHVDFQKIYKQFLTHIKDEEKAKKRYANWVKALNLDETKPYGNSMREQFAWVKKHVDFELWKEDSRAKFWRVDAGYPLESMNQNVYLEDELYRSARTLKHTTVNLNHKFNLPTVDIVAAEYEDGVVEAVLRVPKGLRCPVCSNKQSLNDLIESGGIVNVSLEAICEYNSKTTGACEGMTFTGLALLTKDVLPGIPLTRMMPLEQIMVEALHVDETKGNRRKRKVKRIKMEVLEQDEEPKPRSDAERAKAHFNISDEDWNKLSDEQKQAYIDKLPERGSAEQATDEHGCVKGKQTWDPESETCVELPEPDQFEQVPTVDITPVVKKPSMEPDAEGQCEPGYRINALGKCVPTEDCAEGSHWDANANGGQGGCVLDTVPKPEHPETAHGTPAAPHEDVLTDGPTEVPSTEEQPPITGTAKIDPMPPSGPPAPEAPATLPAPVTPQEKPPADSHSCEAGHHYDYDLDQCVPDTPLPAADMGPTSAEGLKLRLEASTARFNEAQAKGQLKTAEQQVTFWIKEYDGLRLMNTQLATQLSDGKKRIKTLEDRYHTANLQKIELQTKLRESERRLGTDVNDLTTDLRTLKRQYEQVKKAKDEVDRKYRDQMATNLEMSRQLTKAHEDYVEVASKKEQLEGKLNKAKSISKKIIRIKAP